MPCFAFCLAENVVAHLFRFFFLLFDFLLSKSQCADFANKLNTKIAFIGAVNKGS